MTEPLKSITNPFSDQAEFMKGGDQTVGEMNAEQATLYEELIVEEYTEFMESLNGDSLADCVKEANDMLVVIIGWLHSVGITSENSWKAVHINNMLKVANPPIKDPVTKKILKSPEAIAGKIEMMKILKEMTHE